MEGVHATKLSKHHLWMKCNAGDSVRKQVQSKPR